LLAEFETSPYSHRAIEAVYLDIMKLSGDPAARYDSIESLGIVADDFEDVFNKRLSGPGINDVYATPYAKSLPIWTVDDSVGLLDEVISGKLAILRYLGKWRRGTAASAILTTAPRHCRKIK